MQKIIFVTGKGGVGKSSYAAVLAQKYAIQGQKTLLVELGDQSFYKEFFSLEKVEYSPLQLSHNLDIALWSGKDCLKEYALYLLKSEMLYKLFFENKISRSLIQIAPGLSELAMLGKITAGPRKHGPTTSHEVIVVDSYSTGHFLALLKAPKGLSEIIRFGPMGEQSRSIFNSLLNPEICQYHIVTLAEELPYLEGMELYEEIEKLTKMKPKLIFNRVIDTNLKEKDFLEEFKLNDFHRYIKSILQNQENYFTQTNLQKIKFVILPLISQTNSFEFIKSLAHEVSL